MKKKGIYALPLLVGALVFSLLFRPIQVYATGEDYGAEREEEMQEETEPPIPESYYLPIESNDIAGWPAGPQIEAESAIVMEANTGAILYAKNIEAKQYPASITKMMTGLLGVEYGHLDKKMKLSEYAVFSIESGSSHVGLQPNEKITMRQALYGLMLESGNDAANGIAEKVAGSVNGFVQMMNDRAAELGCTNTHFENAHGLHSENHYTCAKDMALISAEAFRNPIFVEIAGTSHYEVPKTNKVDEIRYWVNHHAMISKESRKYEGCLGGKTGYTSDALNTLVTCAEREGMKLVCVVLRVNGSDKALDETKALLDYGFDNFNMTETVNTDASMKRSDLLGIAPFGEGRKLRDAVLDEQVVRTADKVKVVLPKDADAGQLERTMSAGKLNYCFSGWQVGTTSISFTPVDYEIPEPEAPETETQQAVTETEMPETEEQDILQRAVSSVKNACHTVAAWIYENDVFAALAVLVLILMLLPLLVIAYIRDRSSRKIRKARQREREERTKIEKEIDSKTVSEIEAELRANLQRESTSAENVEDDSLEQDSEDKEGIKMNWVSPIKDEETLEKFKQHLREIDDKYYILFEIGVGTGLQLQEILKFKNKDISGKESIEAFIGTKNIKRVFNIPEDLQQIISDYVEGKDPEAFLIQGHSNASTALSREQAYRVFKSVGKSMGLNSIGAQTMRKTFAWRYYKATNDIYYLQNLLNHASPSITYRYIGEKPNVEVVLKKMTPEENERSRYMLYKDNNGKKRMKAITGVLAHLEKELDNPTNNDAFYGRVDCLLTEIEDLIENFKNTK